MQLRCGPAGRVRARRPAKLVAGGLGHGVALVEDARGAALLRHEMECAVYDARRCNCGVSRRERWRRIVNQKRVQLSILTNAEHARRERVRELRNTIWPKQRPWHDAQQWKDGRWYCIACGTRVPTPPEPLPPPAQAVER